MKFFLDFVSCCSAAVGSPEPKSPQRREKMRSFMPLSCTGDDSVPCPKRGKLTGSNSVLSAQWRPSLCSISEDNVVHVVTGKAQRTVKAEKKQPEKAGSKAMTRVRSNSNEFRQAPAPAPVVIPSFSPTPFLF